MGFFCLGFGLLSVFFFGGVCVFICLFGFFCCYSCFGVDFLVLEGEGGVTLEIIPGKQVF